jgi:hypothetical protein
MRQGETRQIRISDLLALHILCFHGHMPDQLYRLLDQTAPDMLSDNKDLKKLLGKKNLPESRFLGLHLWNESVLFRAEQGRRRQYEYGTIPTTEILRLALTKVVVIRTIPAIASYLMGSYVPSIPVPYIPETTTPGVYARQGDHNFQGAVILDCSYYAAYLYYRESGMKSSAAKVTAKAITNTKNYQMPATHKVGLSEITAPEYRTKRRRYTFKKGKYLRMGNSAIRAVYDDEQTAIRMKRTERLKADRILEPIQIHTHTHSTTAQLRNFNALDDLCYSPTPTVESVEQLFPHLDQEILSRTRVRWTHCLPLIIRIREKYGSEYLEEVLRGLAGGGLHHLGGWLLFILSSREASIYAVTFCHHGLLGNGLEHATKAMKALHNVIRRVQAVPHYIRGLYIPDCAGIHDGILDDVKIDFQRLMYLHLLSGRFQDELLGNDGYVEKRDKEPGQHKLAAAGPTTEAEQAAYWDRGIDRAFAKIYTNVLATLARRKDTTPQEMQANTIAMAPRGSINQGKEFFVDMDIPKQNLNKRIWLDSQKTSFFWEVLERTTSIYTNAQIKIELGGRLRQIIPGPIYHWFVESQPMFYLEKAIYRTTEELSLENSRTEILADHEETRKRTIEHRTTLCSDYADFNYLHTIRDMKKFWIDIFKKAGDALSGPGPWNGMNYAGHVSKCASWAASSLDAMFVREVGSDGRLRRVLRGLWSGWRTTSSINNANNFAYDITMRMQYEDAMGYDPILKKRGSGDDGNMAVRTRADALFYLRHLTIADLDVQASKQLVSHDTAEFLRIWYTNGGISGSLARSMGSYVSSDLQAPLIESGPDYVIGSSSATTLLIRRGFDPVEAELIRDNICGQWSEVKYTDAAGVQHAARINDLRLLYAPVEQGGFGLHRYYEDHTYRLASTKPWNTPRVLWEVEGVDHVGAKIMFANIWGRFENCNIRTDPLVRMYRDIVSSMSIGVDTVANRPAMNLVAKAKYEHICWLNKIQPIMVDDEPPAVGMNENLLRQAFDDFIRTADMRVKAIDIPNLEEEKAREISRALGLAAISPHIIKEAVDATTGEPITITEMIRRARDKEKLNLPISPRGHLALFYPTRLIELSFDGSLELNYDFRNVIPDDYLVAADHAISWALRNYFKQDRDANADMLQARRITARASWVIRFHWQLKYQGTYKI